MPVYEHNPTMKFSEILVPTVDSTRTVNILSLNSDVSERMKFSNNKFYVYFFIFTDKTTRIAGG